MPTTPANPQTFLDRDNWMRALLASSAPCVAVRLGVAIAFHLNVKSGRCDPSHLALKKAAHMPLRSIGRWLGWLVRNGWLDVKRGGQGRTNNYVLMIGQHVADQASFPEFDRPLSTDDRPLRAGMIGHFVLDDRPVGGRQQERQAKRDKKKGTRSKTLARSARDTHKAPDFSPGDLKKDAEGESTRAKPQAARAEAFEDFWRAYPRKVAKDAARRAFDKALKAGVDAGALIAGAQRYAVERQGQDPKFTKHPATWLNGGCWEDELPGPIIDQEGNVVAVERPPRQQRYDPSAERWALAEQLKRELCGPQEMEDGDGYLH